MSAPRVALLPGNGYAPVRLEPVRRALAAAGEPFELQALSYPAADRLDDLLDALAERLAALRPAAVHATGIGGLVALALRARGALGDTPLVLQGAVLWGLEHRTFPRLMRLPGATRLLVAMFRLGPIRRRFAAKHFERAHDPAFLEAFFAGYADADDFARWFRWLTPSLLRRLERDLAADPSRLDGVSCWWGERDAVVGLDELRRTEQALGRRFPLRRFAEWGHYPMIDAPEDWVAEVADALAAARDLR